MSSSILYKIAKPLAYIAFRVYFREVYMIGKKHFPEDTPILLASNHPTAFVEPCIMASFQDVPLHFLARGDFFRQKWAASILSQFHIIPIFRLRDGGFSKLKNNYESYAACYEAFRQRKAVLIMAEGSTEHEKRLRPVKKGTARLAFQSVEAVEELPLVIVPVAVNYSKSESFRSVVWIEFLPKIEVKDFNKLYQENAPKAIRTVTKILDDTLRDHVIELERGEEDWQDFYLEMCQNRYEIQYPKLKTDDPSLIHFLKKQQKAIINLPKEKKAGLADQIKSYRQQLSKERISDLGMVLQEENFNMNPLKYTAIRAVNSIGYLINFLPLWLGGYIAKKYIPDDYTFQTPVKITLSMVLYLVNSMMMIILGFAVHYIFWIILGLQIMSGWIFLKTDRYLQKVSAYKKAKNATLTLRSKRKFAAKKITMNH